MVRLAAPSMSWLFALADASVWLDSPELRAVASLWLFAAGGCFGSFLNVVVYRLPRGMSLSYPGSRCPSCGHPIRWHDNVPVLGWLLLGGRCRDCGGAISPRYPLIEVLVAVLLVALAWAEVWLGRPGFSRPLGEAGVDAPALAWGRYALHAALLFVLLSAALAEWDGHALPHGFPLGAAALAIALPTVWPALRGEPLFWPLAPAELADRWWLVFSEGGIGAAAGAAIGALAWASTAPLRAAPPGPTALAATFALVGAALGWQHLAWLASLAAFARLLEFGWLGSRLFRRFSWSGWLALLLCVAVMRGPAMSLTEKQFAARAGFAVAAVVLVGSLLTLRLLAAGAAGEAKS